MQNARRMTVEWLNAATPDESASLARGYLDGFKGNPPPRFTDDFYDHGREQGVSDRTHEVNKEQRRLAWELQQLGRSSTDDEWANECLRRGDYEGWKEAFDRAHKERLDRIMAEYGNPGGD